MSSIEINDVGQVGLIKDQPSHQLPPEAWNFLNNVRIIEDSIGRLGGYSQIFGTPSQGNDSFTKILLEFEGVNTSSTILDTNTGGSAHTWTATGNAQITTATSAVSSGSGAFDGTGDWWTTPDHADFTLGASDLAVDFRFLCTATSGTVLGLCGQRDAGGTITSLPFQIYRSASNLLHVDVASGGSVIGSLETVSQFTVATNTGWHSFAMSRTQGEPTTTQSTFRLYIDTVLQATAITASSALNDSSAAFGVGVIGEFSSAGTWLGGIDNFRLSVGTNRGWTTSTISLPTTPYFTASQQTPHFLMGVTTPTTQYWLWTSLTNAFVTDGSGVHSNVTRTSSGLDVPYTAAAGQAWNGTFIGGIPILNNGNDVPQYWASTNPNTRLANLPNWPTNLRARVIRSFGPYLMALNVTASSVNQPHNVRWSHPADPGSVPSSWDITDPAVDAGSVDLPDVESGIILDGLPLQGRFYVYKENSVWRFRGVGGRFIFEQDAFLETIGLLCSRALAVTGDGKRHIFATQDDIALHDGNAMRSILDRKLKRTLFNSIDVSNYQTSFMMIYPLRNEAWFCYPETGNSFPNRAIIYNYISDRATEGDCDWRHWAQGVVQTSDNELWSSSDLSWDTDLGLWSNANRRKVVLVRTAARAFALLDDGTTRDGTEFTGTLRRTGLGIVGKKRNGEWIEDFQQRKLVTRLWPKVSGGSVSIRVGSQAVPDGAVTWSPTQSFNPATQLFVDFIVEGAAIALEISGTTPFKIDGYKIELELTGNF